MGVFVAHVEIGGEAERRGLRVSLECGPAAHLSLGGRRAAGGGRRTANKWLQLISRAAEMSSSAASLLLIFSAAISFRRAEFVGRAV